MKTTHRRLRTIAALTSLLLVGAVSPALAATTDAGAAGFSDRAAHARGLDWHPTVAIGSGKRKVRFLTCKSGSEGNFTIRYKATTRRSSDRSAPRIIVRETEGSHQGGAEFSLFPGDLTHTTSSGPWGSAAEIRVTLRLLGKVKKKALTAGQIGSC